MIQDTNYNLGEISFTTELVTLESINTQNNANVTQNIQNNTKNNENNTQNNANNTQNTQNNTQNTINNSEINQNIQQITQKTFISNDATDRGLIIRKIDSNNQKYATIIYSLNNTTTFEKIWWPFHALYGGDSYGHVFIHHTSLYLKLLPGANGMLLNCKENIENENCMEDKTLIEIPWEQVS